MTDLYTQQTLERLGEQVGAGPLLISISRMNKWVEAGLIAAASECFSDAPYVYHTANILNILEPSLEWAFLDIQTVRLALNDIDDRVALAARMMWLQKLLPVYNELIRYDKASDDVIRFHRLVTAYELTANENRELADGTPIPLPDPSWVWEVLTSLLPLDARIAFDYLTKAAQGLRTPSGDPALISQGPLQRDKVEAAVTRINWFAPRLSKSALTAAYPELKKKFDFWDYPNDRWVDGSHGMYLRPAIDYLYNETLVANEGPPIDALRETI